MYVDTKKFLSDAKFYEGYARYDDANQRYETWAEAVDRVMGMHHQYYNDEMSDKLREYMDEATSSYKEKRVLGAQRALQFGGDQLLKHQMKMYNCTSSYADRAEYFGEFFYILLCGAGAGFSVDTVFRFFSNQADFSSHSAFCSIQPLASSSSSLFWTTSRRLA